MRCKRRLHREQPHCGRKQQNWKKSFSNLNMEHDYVIFSLNKAARLEYIQMPGNISVCLLFSLFVLLSHLANSSSPPFFTHFKSPSFLWEAKASMTQTWHIGEWGQTDLRISLPCWSLAVFLSQLWRGINANPPLASTAPSLLRWVVVLMAADLT